MLSFDYNQTSNVYVDVNVGVKNHIFKFPLSLDKYDIMIVMQNKLASFKKGIQYVGWQFFSTL